MKIITLAFRFLQKIYCFFLLAFALLDMVNCSPSKPDVKASLPPQIDKINFFLDISASMQGYVTGSTEFENIIPKLLIEIENKPAFENKKINIEYIGDSITVYRKSTKDFIYDIATINIDTGKSSQMDNIFESITNHTDSSDISIFVSDCILSYPDYAIKKNPEINHDKASNLQAFIEDAFLKMKKRNMCASVYRFNSKFNGTYYDYKNDKISLKGDINRPFYMWIIGNKYLLEKFNNQLDSIEDFKPTMQMDFGLFEKPIEQYNLLFKTERQGEWDDVDNNLSGVSIDKKDSIKFAIAVDLSGLPDYAKDENYLKQNLQIKGNNLKCSIDEIKRANDINIEKAAPREKEYLQNTSHVIIFSVPEMYGEQGSIALTLPQKYDTVYRKWSVLNDKVKDSLEGKTFALANLIDGVKEAYENSNDNFIHITINLKK